MNEWTGRLQRVKVRKKITNSNVCKIFDYLQFRFSNNRNNQDMSDCSEEMMKFSKIVSEECFTIIIVKEAGSRVASRRQIRYGVFVVRFARWCFSRKRREPRGTSSHATCTIRIVLKDRTGTVWERRNPTWIACRFAVLFPVQWEKWKRRCNFYWYSRYIWLLERTQTTGVPIAKYRWGTTTREDDEIFSHTYASVSSRLLWTFSLYNLVY